MTADLLALLESDPAAGILAVADLREQRAKAATQGIWQAEGKGGQHMDGTRGSYVVLSHPNRVADCRFGNYDGRENAEHIAAEANPAHALAAVRRWRGVVERHVPAADGSSACDSCGWRWAWPCPDLTETADEARAYLGGTQ